MAHLLFLTLSLIVAFIFLAILLFAMFIGIKIMLKRWTIFNVLKNKTFPTIHTRTTSRHMRNLQKDQYFLYHGALKRFLKSNALPTFRNSEAPYRFEYEHTLKIINALLNRLNINFMFIKLGRGNYSTYGSDVDLILYDYSETIKVIDGLASLQYLPYHLSVDSDPYKITFYHGPPESSIAIDIYQELELGRFYLFNKSITRRTELFYKRNKTHWNGVDVFMPEAGIDLFINIVHDFGHRKISQSGIGRSLDILLNTTPDWVYFIELVNKTNFYGPTLYYLFIIDAYSTTLLGKSLIPKNVINALLCDKIGILALSFAEKKKYALGQSFPLFLIFYDFCYQLIHV